MKLFLAIDPGASGGLAWNDITGTRINCCPMPKTEAEIIALIAILHNSGAVRRTVVMEQVSGFIGKAQPGGAMFSFGEGFGFLKGIILTIGLELILVTPQRWQRSTIPGKKKDYDYQSALKSGPRKGMIVTKNSWKENLTAKAFEIYPNVKNVTPKTADAILILHYAKLFL
jgi:hypothetical protein